MNPIVTQIYDIDKDILGEPQEYKNVKMYPIKLLGESRYKNLLYSLFCYPKNSIQDKAIIKMSYLKFLLGVVQALNKESNKTEELEDFLRHITRKDKIQILFDIKSLDNIEDIKFKIRIEDIEFSEYDFENIREIILQQNGSSIEYINQYDSDLEEKMQFVNNDSGDLTFEENVFNFCAMSGLSIDQIKGYTIYQFKKHSIRLSLWKNYEAFKPVEIINRSKDGEEWVKNYLTHIDDNNRYASILISKKKFLEKNPMFQNNGLAA
jgi:hypothetical protein